MISKITQHSSPRRRGGYRDQGAWPCIRVGVFVALSAYLLFAHGCHGDEDHELFSAVRVLKTGEAP